MDQRDRVRLLWITQRETVEPNVVRRGLTWLRSCDHMACPEWAAEPYIRHYHRATPLVLVEMAAAWVLRRFRDSRGALA